MNDFTHSTHAETSPAEAEELAARVRHLCRPGADQAEVRELREALEVRIVTCNRYLKRLAGWAKRGLLPELASVESAFPELCRASHRLMLPDLRLSWDSACEAAGVEPNSHVDDESFVVVSDAVADAHGIDESVQRFQLAVLGRKPLVARIQCLRDLLAAVPKNDALRRLAKTYEAESIAGLESGCRAAAARGEFRPLQEAQRAIDGMGWRGLLADDFAKWLDVELRRHRRRSAVEAYARIAERVAAAYSKRDLAALGALADEAEDYERTRQVPPGEDFRARIHGAMEWAASERGRLLEESRHREECEIIRGRLAGGASAVAARRMLDELRARGLGVPADIESSVGSLVARASARRRMIFVITSVAGVLGIAAIVAVVLLAG